MKLAVYIGGVVILFVLITVGLTLNNRVPLLQNSNSPITWAEDRTFEVLYTTEKVTIHPDVLSIMRGESVREPDSEIEVEREPELEIVYEPIAQIIITRGLGTMIYPEGEGRVIDTEDWHPNPGLSEDVLVIQHCTDYFCCTDYLLARVLPDGSVKLWAPYPDHWTIREKEVN